LPPGGRRDRAELAAPAVEGAWGYAGACRSSELEAALASQALEDFALREWEVLDAPS